MLKIELRERGADWGRGRIFAGKCAHSDSEGCRRDEEFAGDIWNLKIYEAIRLAESASDGADLQMGISPARRRFFNSDSIEKNPGMPLPARGQWRA